MSLATIVTDALRVLQAANADTLTFAGTSYACLASTEDYGLTISRGGKEIELTKTFAFSPATMPTPGQPITYQTTIYRIEIVRKHSNSSNVNVTCSTPDK